MAKTIIISAADWIHTENKSLFNSFGWEPTDKSRDLLNSLSDTQKSDINQLYEYPLFLTRKKVKPEIKETEDRIVKNLKSQQLRLKRLDSSFKNRKYLQVYIGSNYNMDFNTPFQASIIKL